MEPSPAEQPTDFGAEEFVPATVEPRGPSLGAAQAALRERCSKANIEVKEFPPDRLNVSFPNGEAKRWVSIKDEESARDLLSFSFERYSFLPDYWAICSVEDGFIEATLRDVARSSWLIGQRLFGAPRGTCRRPTLSIWLAVMARDRKRSCGFATKVRGLR